MQIPRPKPAFVSPPNNSSYASAVGCHLIIPLVAQDGTSFELDPSLAQASGYGVSIQALYTYQSSRYRQVKSVGLPPGAILTQPATNSSSSSSSDPLPRNPSRSNLEWIASKGQEGYKYVVCVVAIDSSKAFSSVGEPNDQAGAGEIFCLNVDVQRCRYCQRDQDSLQTVAKAWHGAWLEVWSGNHVYESPDSLLFDASPPLQTPTPPMATIDAASSGMAAAGERNKLRNSFNPVEVGVTYAVDRQDDLWHIALRFGVDLTDILFWNPDLADQKAKETQYELVPNQELCLLPPTCIYAARVTHQPWSSSGSMIDAA